MATEAALTPGREAERALDLEWVRAQFPALHQDVHGKPLVYLDSAATAQRPRAVLEAVVDFYENDNANVHRGLHELARRATDRYEAARRNVAHFLGASDPAEVIFLRGTTEAVNLVASSWGGANLKRGDNYLVVFHFIFACLHLDYIGVQR